MAKRKNLFRLTFWPLRTWRIEARRCYNAREKAKFLKIIWLKLTKKRHHNAWCGPSVRFRPFPNFNIMKMASP